MRRVLVWLSEALIRLIGGSLRMTVEDNAQVFQRADYPPVIIAFWHNRVGLTAYFAERYMSQRTLYTFISLSRDGQFITDVAARFGVKALRGSSSRKGTVAALAAARVARDPRADLVHHARWPARSAVSNPAWVAAAGASDPAAHCCSYV